MRLRSIITLAFARRIWFVAALLLAWVMPTRLSANAVDTVARARIALLAGANLQDDAPRFHGGTNVTSRHKTPPICAQAQRAEHRFGRGGGAEGAGGVGIITNTTKATYRDDGHLLTITDGTEATTTYERDRRGRILKLTDPLGRITTVERDAYGLPTRIIDPAKGETIFQRDFRGNLVWVRDPMGALTRYERDPRGLITQITDANNAITKAGWDAEGNLIGVQEPDGGVWRFTYDAFGRRKSATDPLGHTTHYQHTNRGDLVGVRDALGQVARYAYDGEGHLISVQSPSGYMTTLEWGGYHKLVRRTDPNGHKVRLGYNVEGELTHVWNERGELHALAYTSSGILREEKTFDGRTLSYRHDPVGRPIHIRNGAKEVTELEYNKAGELLLRKLHDESEEHFTYSVLGDLIKAKSPGIELAFERDAVGRIIREVQTLHGVSHVVELQHDLAGDRVGRSTSLGHREQVTRDPAGNRRLTVLDGREITHTPDLLGRDLQRRLPGGGAIESTFDALGRLNDRRTLGPEREILPLPGQPEWVGPTRSNVTAFRAFRYNADGELIETIDRERGRTKFAYDPVGQLLSMVPEKARAELFKYDKTGNLYETGAGAETRVYAKGNRLIHKGNTQYAWDADGRMIEKRTVEPQPGLEAPKEEVWKYTWNGAGLMQKATRSDGLIVECAYDPFARRIEKKVYEQKSKLAVPTLKSRVRFVWDGDVLVHEIREQGIEKGDPVVEERTYWFEDDGFEPLAHRERRVDDVGREHGGWFHYVNDPIGTPERLLAEDGSIATEYERKAWGQLEAKGGAKADTPIRLQGQYWDEETGLAYNRWRYYDGEGRFASNDPLGPPGGFNELAWSASTQRWIDPLGLSVADKLGAAMSDAGRPLAPGQTPHHMVPREGGGKAGKKMRALLKRNGVGIDDAANGAALWGTAGTQVAQPGHPGRDCKGYHGGKVHSKAAYEKLQKELEAAEKRGGRAAVRAQLGNARGRMQNGRWNP